MVPQLKRFRAQGCTAEAVLGIDQQGTSIQALTLALAELDRVNIWHHPSPFTTFHPKLYIFEGDELCEIYIGSNNLTVGGLETNCEAGVLVSYDLPAENDGWAAAIESWSDLLVHPNTVRLDPKILADLAAQNKLLDEAVVPRVSGGSVRVAGAKTNSAIFPFSAIVPPTSRPKPPAAAGKIQTKRAGVTLPAPSTAVVPGVPTALAIQIVPHHYGEVFLSKIAVNQYPAFFGYPFTGQTIPKARGNKPYPQRTPDPITTWNIYDQRGRIRKSLDAFGLNTVYYQLKGEIRITVPPDIARQIPPRSILVMTRPSVPSALDYQYDVFPPGTKQFQSLLPACNQTMPAGGGGVPRRFGWL